MQEKDEAHDRETKTHNENHERVLTMAKEHARIANEAKAELASLQWDMSQIQEGNGALRAEVRTCAPDNLVLLSTNNFLVSQGCINWLLYPVDNQPSKFKPQPSHNH